MKELVVISGKGGTGKTSIAASFAVLSRPCVVADCDVDAADLHLVLSPSVQERHDFVSGRVAVIRETDCAACGACLERCRFGAISRSADPGDHEAAAYGTPYTCQACDFCERSCSAQIDAVVQAMADAAGLSRRSTMIVDPIACEGCGVCVRFCPTKAIDFPERLCGEWFISETRCGPMVHAKLGIAQSNSGKLVRIVRQNARTIAEQRNLGLVIIDGSPGIGCPVIASVTGASLVLVVTEPTRSGEHDLKRVVDLTRHFGIPVTVCINKWDLNPAISDGIETYCREQSIPPAGRVRYDRAFTHAQVQGRTVVEAGDDGAAEDIRGLWAIVSRELERGAHDVA